MKDESAIRLPFIKEVGEEDVKTIKMREAREVFEEEWIPIPYFKEVIGGRGLQDGPQLWARMWFKRISTSNAQSEYTHEVVIAFDTHIEQTQREYLTPTPQDVNGTTFRCASDERNLTFFCSLSWVQEWLESILKRKNIRKDEKAIFRHLAYYFTIIKALDKGNAFPRVSLNAGNLPIEVDLVLDVGNSRTCGIIVETATPGSPFDFTNAKPLKLRDLSIPSRTYSDSFEMRMAFVKQRFGDESAGIKAGNDRAFLWPSMVRVGKEANRLSVIHSSGTSNAIMSSPKRYLWDLDKRLFHWTYISENDNPAAIYGISTLFNEDGVLKQRATDNRAKSAPLAAMNAYYSRSSLMTFCLIEIFLQALSYVNSYEYRFICGKENMPRKLKRIVLTCPTAMLETEKRIFREHAEDAIRALKEFFPDSFIDPKLEIIPSVDDLKREPELRKHWTFDEATCSQLAFLYGEIYHRFQRKHTTFFQHLGKMRVDNTNPNVPSMMIASVDIGGGTTDLMICNHEYEPTANTTVLKPNPQFWEGFNIAGDVIVKSIIERIILPTISNAAKSMGCTNVASAMSFLFGPYLGIQEATDKSRQKQFATEVAYPLAISVIQHAIEERPLEQRSFDSFFVDYPMPNQHLIQYTNEVFRKYGAKDFDLRNLEWSLDTPTINSVVRDVTENMIRDLCLVIAQYNCDYVLLAGRPTMIPIIKDLFLKYLPVSPDRIIPMGKYRIGHWYPFADEQGIIKDPKTCVVVGATIALMGGILGRLGSFTLDTSLLKDKFESTADYIGEFNPTAQRLNNVYISPSKDNYQLYFHGTILLGMKQIDRPDWISTPMYKLYFSSKEDAQKFSHRLPFELEIERKENKEELQISGSHIYDKDGNPVNKNVLRLSMQSLADEDGYWLDTGIFSTNMVSH